MQFLHLLLPTRGKTGAETLKAMPALSSLLTRGRETLPPAGCSAAICQVLGIAPQQDWPVAPFTARAAGLDVGDGYWLRLDPVFLDVGMHGPYLRAGIELDAHGAEALHAALTPVLTARLAGRGMEFVPTPASMGYIRCPSSPQLSTTPLDQVDGHQPMHSLPTGDDAPFWTRLLNEVQMALHDHPFNQARMASGQTPVNSLWPWGGGRFVPPRPEVDAVWGERPLLCQLAAGAGLPCLALPSRLEQVLRTGDGRGMVLLPEAEFDGFAQSADQNLDTAWFRPLLAALQMGRLRQARLTLIGDRGQAVTLTARHAWRLWA
jgi:hypothetical protein